MAQTSLDAGFLNPPNSAKPHTWWHWINGNISKEGITADLEAMKKIGLGGAQIFNVDVGIPAGNTPFMSGKWQEAIAWAFSEAKRLGLEICVHNCAGWSSSGGPWVKPEDAMQAVTWSEKEVYGPGTFEGNLDKPPTKLGFYRDIAVFAVRKPGAGSYRVSNIRAKAGFDRGDRLAPDASGIPADSATPMSDIIQLKMDSKGQVQWDVPPGTWTIMRMGYTPTGAENEPSPRVGLGPEVDKLSRTAMDHFFSGMMASVLKDNGPVGKFGLNNALIDSYEVGSQNWTPKFREEFKKRRGYDPLPYLPAMTGRVVQSGEVTERFLWDVRRTICDLFADNYYGYFKELCHQNGLKFSTEGYGNGSFDNLQVSGIADIPMGEFWVGGGAAETTKLASSAGHTNGKPIIGAESFTADLGNSKYLTDPYAIKALGDRIFTLGINRYIFHRYAHQPWTNLEPGMTMGPWGMNLERTITWWDQGQAWMKYIARCQYLLQSGRFVADVVAFTGEEGPNDLPLLKGNVVPLGYDYDGCDATVLESMKVENGQIVLPSGMRYRVLLLPDSKWMTPKTARKVAELSRAGATIVGPKPTKSPSLSGYPESDAELERVVDTGWTGVATGKSLKDVLVSKKVLPDVESTKPVNWIHRFDQGADIYFVANPAYRPVDVDVTFRADGRQPELWNPESGAMESAPIWQSTGGRTKVSLRLESAGSTFVVFRKRASGAHLRSVTWMGESEAPPKPPKVEVVSARYEATDGAGGVDVTAKVKEMIARGESEIQATNANFGDPVYLHVKHLHIVYTIDGKRYEKNIDENASLTLFGAGQDNTPPDYLISGTTIQAWKPGSYQYVESNGHKGTFKANPKSMPLDVKWKLDVPVRGGAPVSTTLTKLESWSDSDNDAIKYFSGTATYSTSFDLASVSAGAQWLDLGKVKNFAEVELNGHKFDTLWKAPFRLDVSKYLKKGSNSLRIKVTNLWPNRLIGDEQYPDDAKFNNGPIAEWPEWLLKGEPRPATGRTTFVTWKFFNKDSELLESGMIGPVKLIQPQIVKIAIR
ncbi:MAG: hypothetical protein JST51_07250 [Armatimonadetes bacterium]|nr:hypothetical protein [Armatimonadota bacterium]